MWFLLRLNYLNFLEHKEKEGKCNNCHVVSEHVPVTQYFSTLNIRIRIFDRYWFDLGTKIQILYDIAFYDAALSTKLYIQTLNSFI